MKSSQPEATIFCPKRTIITPSPVPVNLLSSFIGGLPPNPPSYLRSTHTTTFNYLYLKRITISTKRPKAGGRSVYNILMILLLLLLLLLLPPFSPHFSRHQNSFGCGRRERAMSDRMTMTTFATSTLHRTPTWCTRCKVLFHISLRLIQNLEHISFKYMSLETSRRHHKFCDVYYEEFLRNITADILMLNVRPSECIHYASAILHITANIWYFAKAT